MTAETDVANDFESLVYDAEHKIEHRNPEALPLVNKIMAEALHSGNPVHYAQGNYILAFYNCLMVNDYDKAIEICEEVLEKVDKEDIREVVYKIYMTLGNACQLKGELFTAQVWYMKGLKQLESRKELSKTEKGFLASFYYNLSLVMSSAEINLSSEDYLEKAIGIYEEIDYRFKLSKSYMVYASVLEKRKEYHKAINLMQKSLELDMKLNEPYNIALTKANLGILYLRVQDGEQGFKYMNHALDYFNQNKRDWEIAMVNANIGDVLCSTGNNEAGIAKLMEAEQVFGLLDNKRELTNVYEKLSAALYVMEDYKRAMQYHRKYVDNLKQFFDVEKTNALTRAKKEFETEQKEKETALLRQKNEEIQHYVIRLERSNNELKQFAHVASHDLREPLRMITAYISLLKKSLGSNLTSQQGEFVAFISDAARRMEQLIVDLLRLAKVDANPRMEKVNLNRVVDEIKLNLEMLVAEKNAVVLCSDLPEITADRTMVLQLLQNIIGNGIKYNQSTQPTVIIKHNLTDKGFEMLISDNGIGIPEHQREKVFEIFNRLHSSQEYSGSGIGLAICKKIVESMGGRIFIENNPAGGTVFRISLPASILVAQ